MMEQIPIIIDANVARDYVLEIKFSDNSIKEYDFSQKLNLPIYSNLKNPGYFKNFSIGPGGFGLIWDDDTDIAEYELWKNGKPKS